MRSLNKIWIIAAGVLALGVTIALAVVGIAPDHGGHVWHSIQMTMKDAVSSVSKGGHVWH